MKSNGMRVAGVMMASLVWMGSLGQPAMTAAITGEVLVSHGDVQVPIRRRIEYRLTDVVNALGTGNLSGQRYAFTAAGYQVANDLLHRVSMQNSTPVQEASLYSIAHGRYEVRDIRVQVVMGATPGSPYQDIVFSLDGDGRITDMYFSVEREHYRAFRDSCYTVQDLARRQQVLSFVELFRTAYNRKDMDFLDRAFSDSALIIVGRVITARSDLPDMLTLSSLGDHRIQFLRRSKAEYLDNLRRIFQQSDFVRVSFDSIEVVQHKKDSALYGVTLKQSWYSGTYSDTGWVFLMADFKESENPVIYVRTWQPERFEDGSVINLYNFQVVR